MYKVLLCWRYLLTRYLALACVVSVMLGVATLIVVNSVMSGFSTKLRVRLHGLLSDIVVESIPFEGFAEHLQDPENRLHPSFQLRGEGLRRYQFNNPTLIPAVHLVQQVPGEPPPPQPPPEEEKVPEGIILGHAIASFRKKGISADEPVKDIYVLERGDEVVITTVMGARLAPAPGLFVVTDYFK